MVGISELRTLWASQRFDEALSLVDRLLSKCPDCPYLLVTRGMAIQLLDHQGGPPLHEAERSFLRALEIEPDYLAAIEELAHYYDAVADDTKKAQYFAREYLRRVEPSLKKLNVILSEKAD